MRHYKKTQSFMLIGTTPHEAGAEVAKCIDTKTPELQLKESILTRYEQGENMIHVNDNHFIAIEDCGHGYINVDLYAYIGDA